MSARQNPDKKRRVLVAMSGGVDSSVAAALLVEAGLDVVGVTMHLWDASGDSQVGRCCAPEDRDDARRVADHLGFPHYVVDERESFRAQVVEPFLASYGRGETPSPCVHCNKSVKMGFLTKLADRFGADTVATGHYARVERGEGDAVRLFRGRDYNKDQSYFLFGLAPEVLRRLEFPLGELEKTESRAEARRLGLPNADKPDSQELCFIPDGDVRAFAEREAGRTHGGRIVAEDGTELGRHEGIEGFTVGQRKGLGLGGGPPRYVLRILPDSSDVVVGDAAGLSSQELEAVDAAWPGGRATEPFEAQVRIRYRHDPAPAEVTPTVDGFRARFRSPQRAITPGQATVVYQGDEVIAGGFISKSVAD